MGAGRFGEVRRAALLAVCVLSAGCASLAEGQARQPPDPRAAPIFWNRGDVPLGHPTPEQLRNTDQDRSPRISEPAFYDRFWATGAARLRLWALDPRLLLNPNFVAALLTKESGFDPLATSNVPANGLAQITHIADLDLRILAEKAPIFQWMNVEVSVWPRHPAVHSEAAKKEVTDSLVRAGALKGDIEYLFDEEHALRAATFWLRMLAEVWLQDEWPGMYGGFAKKRLNGGRDLTEPQLLDLVTVSYNQGHPYVYDLVKRHGRNWTKHLNPESRDYLERIRAYTVIYQKAPQ